MKCLTRLFGVAIAALALLPAAVCPLAALAAPPSAANDGFRPIFDGKTLDGWDGNPQFWHVEDGAITGETTKEHPAKSNTFLIWRGGKPADFELKAEFRMPNPGFANSGIQIRSWEGPERWRVSGYQPDMDWQNEYTGFCYGENYRGILAERGQKVVIGKDHKPKVVRQFGDSKELAKVIKKQDWNEYDIIAVGNQIIQKINGQLMCVVTDEDTVARKAGIIALQLHAGRPMKVQFRNIRLQELFGKVAGTRHWEIVFAKGNTPDLYARQLDFFGIEIGIVKPGGKIDYAFHLSQPKPDTRTTSEVEDETRYWLRWPDVDEEARKLVEKAGLNPGSGALLKFIPRETELKLCTLEQTMAGPQRSKNIKKTRFGVKPAGSGFEFYIIEQQYK